MRVGDGRQIEEELTELLQFPFKLEVQLYWPSVTEVLWRTIPFDGDSVALVVNLNL
jgi:hypothetical protein